MERVAFRVNIILVASTIWPPGDGEITPPKLYKVAGIGDYDRPRSFISALGCPWIYGH